MKMNGENKNTGILPTLTAAVLVVVFIFTVALFTLRENGLHSIRTLLSSDSAEQFTSGAEKLYSDGLAFKNSFIRLWALSQRIGGSRILEDAEYGYLIRDSENKLHFHAERTPDERLEECAESTAAFARKCAEEGIPFLYIQAPNKNLRGHTVFPAGAVNASGEDADIFLSLLDRKGTAYLDLREYFDALPDPRKSGLFYATDHHWTTGAAFDGFAQTVGELDRRFGLALDPDGFFRDAGNYKSTVYEDCFIGSLGRRVTDMLCTPDDYTFIEPDFETDYTVYDLLAGDGAGPTVPSREGNFREALVAEDLLTDPDPETNRHAAYFRWDYGDLVIRNNRCENSLRILLIKDSFALPFAAFLSSCVSELHMIDLRDENAPVPEEYVRRYDFDAVMVLYNTEIFFSPMFDLCTAE